MTSQKTAARKGDYFAEEQVVAGVAKCQRFPQAIIYTCSKNFHFASFVHVFKDIFCILVARAVQ